MTFQDMILALDSFWGKQGCIIGQPYGVELGAGTGNPHTFLRALGPEPYNVAYVEPSRRPTDGRYGKSPNRFQHYYQYQVLLKPAPKFNQELYIESLRMLGIDPRKHDIRFVEDNWEAIPSGAWGLGWEIWCDGMEISQYTYFQQMAGIPIEVPTLEITYGLERLAMYIQDVTDYHDVKWNNSVTYADIFERHEFWQATHNFETSSVDSLKQLFEIYEKEANSQIAQKNYWAAYDYSLKLSHLFNLLDAHGAVSLSDRVAKFGMMGKLAKQVGTMYLEERKEMGYPLMHNVSKITYKPPVQALETVKKTKYQKDIAIVELGFEELPATYLTEWSSILTHSWLKEQLKARGITYRKAYLYTTPRRIVIKLVQPSEQGRVEQLVKGPSVQAAYDKDGNPTQVLEGFLSKHKAKLSAVKQELVNEKPIITIKKEVICSLKDALQQISEAIIASAPKTKWMMWDEKLPAFIRPLRWIIAYHNDKKLPLSLMNVTAGNTSPVPRYELPALVTVNSAQEYTQFVRAHGILLSAKKRSRRITQSIEKLGFTKSGKFNAMITQNTNLTENPHTATVQLDEKYTVLPRELVTLILEKNQMYPISVDAKNSLWYTIVANQFRVHKRIVMGNQKVARARLEDGLFYFEQDAKHKLIDLSEKLKNVNFHPKLGSYADKKERITRLNEEIYGQIKAPMPEATKIALTLIKNDKASALGKEFPSLEGTIGKVYALRDGYPSEVANLLADHYLPYEPEGEIPSTKEAQILSVADKFDTLVALSSVEKLPEGSHDPFEIRKTVYRLLALLTKANLSVDLGKLRTTYGYLLPELQQYMNRRFQQMLEDEGVPFWIARGVGMSASQNFADKYQFAKDLQKAAQRPEDVSAILDTFKRVKNIIPKDFSLDAAVIHSLENELTEPAEHNLLAFIVVHDEENNRVLTAEDIPVLAHLLEKFFTDVLVLDKDEHKKNQRLSLLAKLSTEIEQHFKLEFA